METFHGPGETTLIVGAVSNRLMCLFASGASEQSVCGHVGDGSAPAALLLLTHIRPDADGAAAAQHHARVPPGETPPPKLHSPRLGRSLSGGGWS